ncbi:MAG: hypothetical protein NDJ89_17805 [Oligoflexia bacterium]|nr:hypothetical protein [Oligoflexia bacterium]
MPNLEQIFGEAEQRFRKGLSSLADWSEQARGVIQDRPGTLTASLAIVGFMAGLVTRKGGVDFAPAKDSKPGLFADPVVVFVASAIAGFAFGPKLMESALNGRAGRSSERGKPSIEHH